MDLSTIAVELQQARGELKNIVSSIATSEARLVKQRAECERVFARILELEGMSEECFKAAKALIYPPADPVIEPDTTADFHAEVWEDERTDRQSGHQGNGADVGFGPA